VDTTRRYYLGPAGVTTDAVRRARVEFVTGPGWTVHLTLTRAGSRAWDALAEQQFHQQVAITASGKVVSAPIIQPSDATFESFGGTAVIGGSFTRKQAEALALLGRPAHGR
jgi:preprotein translocase subunit SecD